MRTLAYMPVVEVQGYNAHNKLQVGQARLIHNLGWYSVGEACKFCTNFTQSAVPRGQRLVHHKRKVRASSLVFARKARSYHHD